MSTFKVDTPNNIDALTEQDILLLCNSDGIVKSPKARIKMIKIIYKILGYDLSPDLMYALADETKEQLILALAGGGKTTTVSIKIALEKIYRESKFTKSGKLKGDRVLSLVYNKNNVRDMVDRHNQIISVINSLGIEDLQLDYDLECRTMHSFCLKWLKQPEYSSFLGLINYKLIEADRKSNILNTAIQNVCKKFNITKIPHTLTANAISELYNYMVETKSNLIDLENSEKVVDLGVEVEVIDKIITTYNNVKRMTRVYDYTDLLVKFKELLDTNEEARIRIKEYYDFITADEIQDFTPLLKDILHSIVGDHTMLVCIGDDDQSIYAFRGADNNNALRFKDTFPNAKIHLLKTNRRCPSNVLHLADSIIRLNTDRFPKVMKGVKGPGEIHFKGYNDRIGQYISMVNLIKGFNDSKRADTVIAYREKYSSLVLSNLLYESNMPFHVISGHGPFDFELFNHVISVMNALNSGGYKRKLLHLYKVLPVSKVEMQEALHYDPKKNSFTDGKDYVDIDKIEFSSVRMNNEIFVKTYSFLIAISKRIDIEPLNRYIPNLIGLIQRNFWKFMIKDSNLDPDITDYCIKKCINFFNKNVIYKEVYAFYISEKERLSKWNSSKSGVGLSTFHSLKGLEFNDVMICDLAESIFPNFGGIDFRPYDDETKKSLKECENRLFYVAVTRSKKNLYFFYSNNDPSFYISILKGESHTQAEIGELVDYDGEVRTAISQSNVFENIDNLVTDETDTSDNLELPSEEEQVTIELDEGVSVKSKEVPTYQNSYMNNLMNSLFKHK